MRRLSCCVFLSLVLTACSSDGGSGPAERCTIRGLSLGEAQYALVVGQSVQANASIEQSGCTALPTIEWSSSDPLVVNASPGGVLTAVAVGRANITARLLGRSEQFSALVTVTGRVLGITMTQTVASIPVGTTHQLNASLDADPGTPTTLQWRTSDAARATVNASGLVTGVAAGQATITVVADADTTRRASAIVTVIPRVLGITVSPARETVFVSGTRQLLATVQGDSGVGTSVSWRSSQPAIASVSTTGLVTALAAGRVEVTAQSTVDSTRQAAAVIVVLPRILGVSVTPSTAMIDVAATTALMATITGDPGASPAVSWSSSDPLHATVSSAGVVTGVAPGIATITARSVADTTRSATSLVTVRPRVLGIAVTPTTANMSIGGTLALTATVNGDPGIPTGVTWSTSDASRATVSSGGVVTALAVGSVTIVARSVAAPSLSASAGITITPRVLSVSVAPANASINVSSSLALTATVTGDPGASTSVTWSTANAAVATVSASGIVTGIAVGSTVITAASTVDPARRGSTTITVTSPVPQLPQVTSLCFAIPPSGNNNQRVAPTTRSRITAGVLTCATTSQLDLVAGQSTVVFPMINGVPGTVSWQLPGPSPVASFGGDGDALDVSAGAPGSLTIGASSGGLSASIALRVLGSTPGGFCISATPGGACMVNTSLKVGQTLVVYGSAGGQPAAALWQGSIPSLYMPPHIGTRVTFTPSAPGTYLLIGESTAGGGSALLVASVTP